MPYGPLAAPQRSHSQCAFTTGTPSNPQNLQGPVQALVENCGRHVQLLDPCQPTPPKGDAGQRYHRANCRPSLHSLNGNAGEPFNDNAGCSRTQVAWLLGRRVPNGMTRLPAQSHSNVECCIADKLCARVYVSLTQMTCRLRRFWWA